MMVWFTVQLEDKPGSLARVAAAHGERGVNITGIVGVAEDTDGAHGVHNAMVDDVEAVKRCVTPQIDGGNDEALVPGFLTHKAAEERLARTVVAAQAPDPGSAILAEFQVSAEVLQFFLTADSDANQAAGRDEAAWKSLLASTRFG